MKNIPFLRGFAYDTAPYHVGSVLENKLGLQVLRTLSKYALSKCRKVIWKVRRPRISDEIKPYVELLEREGIVAIEDFLPAEIFKTVAHEFERANRKEPMAPYKGAEDAKLWRTQILASQCPEEFSSILKNFQNSDLLNEIVSEVVCRRIEKPPPVFLDKYQNLNGKGSENDIENILHSDLHTSTIKVFFYLDDVDETNGAFIYARRSHRLTPQRLVHEYELSIRQAKLKKGMLIPVELLANRGSETRNVVKPTCYRAMGIEETQFVVKPNTLVIANNMGFHRRGEFTEGKPRKAIVVNYRYLERSLF